MQNKLKYQGGITKKICMFLASKEREKFSKILWSSSLSIPDTKLQLNIGVVSFSGIRDFEEQVLSIISFLKFAGKPKCWTIYNDGTYSEKYSDLLRRYFDFITVLSWDTSENLYKEYDQVFESYIKFSPLGKRLYAYVNHLPDTKTLFIDSDIIFYSKIKENLEYIKQSDKHWYLPDIGFGTLDSRFKSVVGKEMFQLNGGCFITNKEFDWRKALNFLQSLQAKYEYFSDQTAFHIAFSSQESMPLDPRTFILSNEDQFDFSNLFQPSNMSLRHYVTPVRHKIWQKGWEWHLKD